MRFSSASAKQSAAAAGDTYICVREGGKRIRLFVMEDTKEGSANESMLDVGVDLTRALEHTNDERYRW